MPDSPYSSDSSSSGEYSDDSSHTETPMSSPQSARSNVSVQSSGSDTSTHSDDAGTTSDQSELTPKHTKLQFTSQKPGVHDTSASDQETVTTNRKTGRQHHSSSNSSQNSPSVRLPSSDNQSSSKYKFSKRQAKLSMNSSFSSSNDKDDDNLIPSQYAVKEKGLFSKDDQDETNPFEEEPFMKPKRPFVYPPFISHTDKTKFMKQELRSSLLYWSLKRTIKGELIKSKYSLNDVKSLIPKILDQHNLKVKLKNEIYRLHQEASKKQFDSTAENKGSMAHAINPRNMVPPTPVLEEPLDVVEQVRKNWSLFLKDQIMSISHQLKVPLYQPKKKDNPRRPFQKTVIQPPTSSSGKKKLKKGKSNKKLMEQVEVDDPNDDMPKYTGVYGPSKLFETCVNIHNSNHERTFSTNIVGWGLIKLELEPLSITDLRERFSDLDPMNRQVGLDDQSKEWFSNDAISTAKRLSSGGYIPVLGKVARRGIPTTQRGKIWKQLLGVSGSSKQKAYFDMLQHQWNSSLMLIDDMVINDVKRTSDDENYFVFEELILTVMQAFSRDSYIAEAASLKPVSLYGVDKVGKKRSCYPPNGVVPFEGLSLLVAPFTYIFTNPVDTYFAFRGMYIKYFCRLHVISSKPQSLLPLCKQFESMLQNMHPHLYYHLLELNIHPLDIAVNWIFHAFAGYLQVEQLLLLWDRIIGFSDLNLLPVLAVSIFLFRAKPVMQTTSQQEIFDIFSDFSTVEVIPLLQAFIFRGELLGFSDNNA